jgi:hypothetical protein
MDNLAATDLLSLWERAGARSAHERALELLGLALPDVTPDSRAALDLGLRDWHLLRLRAELFGYDLPCYGDCPHCGERLDITLDARAYACEPLPYAREFVDRGGSRWRLPNTLDLIAAARCADAEEAERVLFERCRIGGGAPDRATFTEVDDGLASIARARALELELTCAECAGTWALTFDPASFLWEELNARALTLLDEVHRLALHYGWSERDILALSEARRRAYLARLQ